MSSTGDAATTSKVATKADTSGGGNGGKEIVRQECSVEVIGCGWGRTGNTSFQKAIDILGLGPCYHM